MKTALAAVLSFALAITAFAQTGNPPPKKEDAPKKASADILRKLSRRERRELTSKLDSRFQDFLADVDPIILGSEIDTFLMLSTDAQRDSFIEEFWRRRDATMGANNGRFKDVYERRLEVAKDQFKRLNNERAKLFLLHGPPAEVVRSECDAFLQPIEIWKYPFIKGLGYNVRLLFYKPRELGDYRLWNPIGGNSAISDLLSRAAFDVASNTDSMTERVSASASPYAYLNRIQLECRQGDEVMRAITQMVQSRIDLMRIFEPPAINDEDVAKILRSMVIENPNAKKLETEFSVKYPTKDGSRTDVQMTLMVPREQIAPAAVGDAEVYTIDVTGEVLKDGQLWEKYRYRFDFPGDFTGDKLPIVVDRLLRPAQYTSRIKVTDANTGAEAIVENALEVPEIFVPEPSAHIEQASIEPVVATAEAPAKALAPPPPPDGKPSLRIVPPSGEVVTGIQTIETMISGEAIKGVEFWLDGRKLAVRRAPPFSLDFDFGDIPQTRRIRAVALDAKNQPLTGDDLYINTGTDPFRVRIVSPRIAPHLVGPSRVEVGVHVPDGEELDALELYWNETRVATMFDPPFVQTVNIPATDGVGYIRAVAKLKDPDAAPIEDVVMINTPAYMEELNVHLVEIPTVVTINGKPATELTEKSFTILDEGKPVPIAKFEYVRNLPLSIGMAIDTSGSMQPRMDEAQKAGAQFFENVMKKGDKAFLVSFATEPELVQKWSTRIQDVHAGLAKLRAEESTAIWDAVIFSLYNFQGIKGQKALVLISDGKDTSSKYSFEQALEYARRMGVPIYAIGIGMRGNEIEVRPKLSRLCNETGGTLWTVDQARDLQRVYNEIQTELRSQYILGFYPPGDLKTGSKWRELTVQVSEGKAKSAKGYFP